MPERDSAPSQEPAAATAAERRAFVRLASDLEATCRPVNHSQEVGWPGRVGDISRGGLGILMRHRLKPGSELAVELRDHTGRPLRTVIVCVAHATAVLADGSSCWLLGCAFYEPLSEEEFQALC
jgi:hypothetical protein